MGSRLATLGKEERLRKRSQYLKLYNEGTKVSGRHFYVYFLENELDSSRLGITVSRRVGKPVVRNRIKRLLREVFRKHKHLIHPSADLVINATKSSVGVSLSCLEKEFLQAVKSWNYKRRAT